MNLPRGSRGHEEATWVPMPCHLHNLLFISPFASSASGKTETLRLLEPDSHHSVSETTRLKKKTDLPQPKWLGHCLPQTPSSSLSSSINCFLERQSPPFLCVGFHSLRGRQVLPVLRFSPRREQTTPMALDTGCGLSAMSLLALCTLESHPSAKALSPTERRGSQTGPPYARAVAQEVPRVWRPRQRD